MRQCRPCASRHARQDHELRRRIFAFNIRARIRLGVPNLLRLSERLLIRPAFALHLGEDVVGGAVDDPLNRSDLVRRHVARQHANHGYARRNGRFKTQRRTRGTRERLQPRTEVCQQQLVRRHHRSASFERRLNNAKRRIKPAHQLNNKIHIRCSKGRSIGGQRRNPIKPRSRSLGHIAHRNARNVDPPLLVSGDQTARHGGTDRPPAEEGDAEARSTC